MLLYQLHDRLPMHLMSFELMRPQPHPSPTLVRGGTAIWARAHWPIHSMIVSLIPCMLLFYVLQIKKKKYIYIYIYEIYLN